jgi:tetratricopeptide (TPR) repeat protein
LIGHHSFTDLNARHWRAFFLFAVNALGSLQRRTIMRRFTLMACTALLANPAFAVGSEDETPPTPTDTTLACEDGQILDEKTETCVDAEQQSFNDDDRYRAVRELAYAGAYDRALKVIKAADNPTDARFLNYRGFILRQTGDMGGAMAFYTAALRSDPDYILARSYMGMGLVQMGHVFAAKAQLQSIADRGGEQTWAYRALSDAINGNTQASY